MEPESWPRNAADASARLREVVDRIDHDNEEQRLELLSDLLCAAWGSFVAQNH
jgi:hypothetical protein